MQNNQDSVKVFMRAGLVKLALVAAEVVGGVLSGSLALIADAVHSLADSASIFVAMIAAKIAKRTRDEDNTFGYRRAEIIGAAINTVTLFAGGIFLFYEACGKLAKPTSIDGGVVILISIFALGIDLIVAWITAKAAGSSVNGRVLFLHNIGDALSSVAVIVAGLFIAIFDLYIADFIATVLIATYILYQAAKITPHLVRLLMLGVPNGLKPSAIAAEIRKDPLVIGVHSLHIWEVAEKEIHLSAHIMTVPQCSLSDVEGLKVAIKKLLHAKFGVAHATLEFDTNVAYDL